MITLLIVTIYYPDYLCDEYPQIILYKRLLISVTSLKANENCEIYITSKN